MSKIKEIKYETKWTHTNATNNKVYFQRHTWVFFFLIYGDFFYGKCKKKGDNAQQCKMECYCKMKTKKAINEYQEEKKNGQRGTL